MKRLFAVSGIILAIAGGINAAPPAWWSDGNPPVIDPQAAPNNHGAANIGQAKWMAKSALDALRAKRPDLATLVEADLVGTGKPIASWATPVTTEQQEQQRRPLLLGQLKAIAAPFYDRLQTADPTWLAAQATENGMPSTGSYYPWTSTTADDANKSMATIGQLKVVFSLRFEDLAAAADPQVSDGDEDGLPDAWEIEHGLDPDDNSGDNGGDGDFDGDGVSNANELEGNSAPNDPADFPVQVIEIDKVFDGGSNYTALSPPQPSYSGHWSGGPSWTDAEMEGEASGGPITPAYLNSILEGIAFPATPPPRNLQYNLSQPGRSLFASSFATRPGYNWIDTHLNAARFWIKAPAAPVARQFAFLKTRDYSRSVHAPNENPYTLVSAEVVTVEIPANETISNPIDLKYPAPIIDDCIVSAFERLKPVELIDVKNHSTTYDDVIIAGWDTTQNIQDKNIAWIEAHFSESEVAPRMPQLEFRIPGLGQDVTIEAKLEVQYNRGNGARAARNQPQDRVRIPANGNFAQVNGSTWNIYNETDWQTEMAQHGFFGGEATLTYRLMKGQTQVVAPQTMRFRIGGKNPEAARARQYIESLADCGPAGSLWFAYAIARSESRDYNGNGSRYNQFLRLPQNPRDNGFPLWGNDGGTRPGGYGMFQVTGTVQDSEANIPRDQIWNWQTNASAARVIIVDKRRAATNWMTTQTNATHANGTAIPSHTTGNVTFDGTTYTMTHACTIKAYNGASKPASDIDSETLTGFVLDSSYPSIGHYGYWHSGQSKWGLCRFNSLGFNYVLRVCEEVQP